MAPRSSFSVSAPTESTQPWGHSAPAGSGGRAGLIKQTKHNAEEPADAASWLRCHRAGAPEGGRLGPPPPDSDAPTQTTPTRDGTDLPQTLLIAKIMSSYTAGESRRTVTARHRIGAALSRVITRTRDIATCV